MPASGLPLRVPARLQAELARCLGCETKPCREACPVRCSPADFIAAAKGGEPWDLRRAAALILDQNPLGGLCGALCPDRFCVAACARGALDAPIAIPAVQAALVARASAEGLRPAPPLPAPSGRRVAVLGGGPAGLAAAALLARRGHRVELFEREGRLGGQVALVPPERLDPEFLAQDLAWIRGLGTLVFHMEQEADPSALRARFDAVLLAAGPGRPARLGIPGDGLALDWRAFLADPGRAAGRRVLVAGGGAVAVDCATAASRAGAAEVALVYRRRLADMPLGAAERAELLAAGIDVLPRTRLAELHAGGARAVRLRPAEGTDWAGRRLEDVPGTGAFLPCDLVVYALGAAPAPEEPAEGIFRAAEAGTVVEAAAAGKEAAQRLDAWLARPRVEAPAPGASAALGLGFRPVDLTADFFGRRLRSPFLLSAGPHTDGYAPMRAAYEAGWAGGVMKTAFDGVPIHIPGAYMHVFGAGTFGNCDNVSGHSLDRVCAEVARLVREFPDRLTLASTGGPVTGDAARDAAAWRANTRKLEAAGAMGIEYSLSCPQGGDGTKGDLVSQDPELTARVIGWVLEGGDPEVPKLFKLTAAVTSLGAVLEAVRAAFARFPRAKAGVTLANSFPSLAFRPGAPWRQGVLMGLSGEGVRPLSALALARAGGRGLVLSGNGGVMGARDAADFLALGASTIQLCSLVMKEGLGVREALESGVSFLLAERGLGSVAQLVACAQPGAMTPFEALSPVKQVSALLPERCLGCGLCVRCGYQAIVLDGERRPVIAPSACVGCAFCVQACPAGALFLRDRLPGEETEA